MPFRQLLKSPYQYFKNRNGIFRELKLNLRWEQWSNILIWQLFENLPKIEYFLAYVNRSIGPTIKIILSVQDNFCRTFATVRRTFGMTAYNLCSRNKCIRSYYIYFFFLEKYAFFVEIWCHFSNEQIKLRQITTKFSKFNTIW
jgi:hypothetical protein